MRLCRPVVILFGLASLIFASPLRADEKSYGYARIVRLSMVRGEVQVARSGSSEWENAIPNMPIQQGFTIGTNNGRAEIEFESGAAMWIAENTVVQFSELALSDGGRITRITETQGTASFEAKLHPGDEFEVITAGFNVKIADHARIRMDAYKDGGSLSVYAGSANVEQGANSQLVSSGKTFAIRGGEQSESELAPNPAKDSWDNWVNDRTTMMETGAAQTAQYTDSPVTYGMSDLSSYGSWLDCAGQGFGWQPWGVSSNWAPFYDGYFDYYNSIGWTWISFEPWGWAPYHFGNWAYDAGCGGWMWFPGAYGFWNAAPLVYLGTGPGGRGFGWRPQPVHWTNPHRVSGTLATETNGTERDKFASMPIVLGQKGGIGNGFPTGILAPDKAEVSLSTAVPPGKSGKFSASEGEAASRSNFKPPLAVTTASSLAELRGGITFDDANYRFVDGGGAGGGGGNEVSEKLPVLANGARAPHAIPRQPEPSGFAFSRESIARITAEGRTGSPAVGHSGGFAAEGGAFSHGGEAAHAGFGGAEASAHSGGASSSSSSSSGSHH